ncbi:MAG: hypothetical protein RBR13_03455 [Tenuifilaceae bacterium]|nr:hypothetical protein [Tenuifilaceae bacterium]
MKKKINILFVVFLSITPGFKVNGSNPMEFLDCYVHVIKRAIEEQKWNLNLIEKDGLCIDYFSSHDFVIDNDTLRVVPNDYSKNKYSLKSFLFSDSVAIIQFVMDTVLVNEKDSRRKKHKGQNSIIEFNVVLDSSKETGVRVNFGRSVLYEDKNKGKKDN